MSKYDVKGLNRLSKQLNEFVKRAGFDGNDTPLRFMLTVSEISEAFEAFRNEKFAETSKFKKIYSGCEPETVNDENGIFKQIFKEYIKDTVEDELADSVIRLLDLCGKLDIDIEWHILQKMKYNELRGFKYGGKKF